MTEEQMYRAAAKLLRRDGWCQKNYRSRGAHCIIGAIADASGIPVKEVEDRILLPESIINQVTGWPIHFNDSDDMTKRDVIAALEIAADLATPSP